MTGPAHPARIILGATTLADATGTLALATALAVAREAEIHGLLVEDDEVMALVTAHAACILAPSGGPVGMVEPARLRAAFAREAARFERLLVEAAERAALRRSFSRERGRLGAALAAMARPGDLMVIPAGPFRVPVREVVLLSAGDAGSALAGVARATAERLGRPLRAIVLPEAGRAHDAAGLAALESLGPGSVLFAELAHTGLPLDDLLRLARGTHVLLA